MNRKSILSLALGLAPALAFAGVGESFKSYLQDPLMLAFTVAVLFLVIALLAVNKALNTIKYLAQPHAVREAQAAKEEGKSIMDLLTDAAPLEKENDILTDHDYDGIKELDNNLPPWWLWGFYLSIVFAVVYVIRFHVVNTAPLQGDEFTLEMTAAEEDVKAYLATAANLVDESNVVALTGESDLAKGKEIYNTNCVACHAADGGGLVGPNLTDEYWIHGGGIANIFKTIKYGVPAKGMISWKDQLNPGQMQAVASYIMTLQGTTPASPKAAEGNLYQPQETTETPSDSSAAAAAEAVSH